MAISCPLATIRCVLMMSNLFCLLCGFALILLGALMRQHFVTYNGLFTEDHILENESIMALVLGSVIFTVAFFGFCGTCMDSPAMLNMYAFLLSVLMVVQTALAVTLFLGFDETRRYTFKWFGDKFDEGVQRSLKHKRYDAQIEAIQDEFQCCGKRSYREWGPKLPKSCCAKDGGSACIPFEHGCLELLEVSFERSSKAVAWMLLVFSTVEFVAVVCSCYLAHAISKESSKKRDQQMDY